MSTPNSENVSQKRGRPRLMDDGERALAKYATDSRSERSLHNVHYRSRAIRLLDDHPELHWLGDPAAIMARKGALRMTILTELGRIPDDDDRLRVAREICEMKPRTRDAIAMIRSYRRGGLPAGSSSQLAAVILDAISAYAKSHAGCDKGMARDAISKVSKVLAD